MARKEAKVRSGRERTRPQGCRNRARREALALLLIVGLCLYLLLSLFTFTLRDPTDLVVPRGDWRNLGGVVGYYLADSLLFVFGFAAYVLVVFGVSWGVVLLMHRQIEKMALKALGAVVFTSMVALLLAGPEGVAGACEASPYGGGGKLGANLSPKLHFAFGGSGRILLLIFGALFSLLLATEWLFSAMMQGGMGGIESGWQKLKQVRANARAAPRRLKKKKKKKKKKKRRTKTRKRRKRRKRKKRRPEEEEEEEPVVDVPVVEEELRLAEVNGLDVKEEPPRPASQAPPSCGCASRVARSKPAPVPADTEYPFPPLELFQEAVATDESATQELIERNARAIERRLGSFKIGAQGRGCQPGPGGDAVRGALGRGHQGVAHLQLRAGPSRCAEGRFGAGGRADSRAATRSESRSPMPSGRSSLCVSCSSRLTVDPTSWPSRCFSARTWPAKPIVEDLTQMPHLLIAGTTGSGKSVAINSILLSILMTRTPAQVRLILIDPKMVELQHYAKVPHLSCEVVCNMKKAPGVLEWAVEEMEKRYALLSSVGVNSIKSFNKLGVEELEKRLQRPVEPADGAPAVPGPGHRRARRPDGCEPERGRGVHSAACTEVARRRFARDYRDAATEHRRDHRCHQGEPALPDGVQGEPQDRLPRDPGRQRC